MVYLQVRASSSSAGLLEWLVKQDKILFVKINSSWTNTALDSFFPLWRESITWAPLYLFLFLFVVLNFRSKAWPWICFLLLTATITDQVSSNFLKEWIGRPRPCTDPGFFEHVRLLMNRCPGSGSFTSSHATSHFGAAVFISMTMKDYFKRWRLVFFLWAATISYGQVYVGVHYPLDVIGGAVLGWLIGWATATIYNNKVPLSLPGEATKTSIRI